MTPQNKTYLYIGIGAAALIATYFLLNRKESNGSGTTDPTGNGTTPVGDINNFDAAHIADLLEDAMEFWGTYDDALISLLRTVNQDQFGQIVKAFGKRNYGTWPFNSDETLQYWMKEELSAAQYNTWKLKYPKYL